MNLRLLLPFAFSVSLLVAGTLSAQDWPQWRGANLDNIAEGEGPAEVGAENLLWQTPLPGPAGSSPIVVGEQVFLTTIDGDELWVICLSATDGTEQWKRQVPGVNKDSRDSGNSASNSPISDGKHVWTMFGNGMLNCFTTAGEEVWSIDLQKKYGKFEIMFGMATSPIMHDGQLLLALLHGKMKAPGTSVGKIISFDPATGDENWLHIRKTEATKENKHSYASPSICSTAEGDRLLVQGGDYITAHSLTDGSEVWRLGGLNPKASYNQTLRLISSPVAHGDLVVVPTAKRGPVFGLSPEQSGEVAQIL